MTRRSSLRVFHLRQQRTRTSRPDGTGADWSELIDHLASPAVTVRRHAASAIGRLAGFGAEPGPAVAALAPLALGDPHPQVQQAALKALAAFGATGAGHVDALEQLAHDPCARPYVRHAARKAAAAIIRAANPPGVARAHPCMRCGIAVTAEAYVRSRIATQRTLCDPCLAEELAEGSHRTMAMD